MKYAFIERHRCEFRVVAMCRVLGASRSGYYDWRGRRHRLSGRARWRRQLDARVKTGFYACKRRYGGPRLTVELAAQGHGYDEKTVQSSLRRQGLRAKAARRFKVTTEAGHGKAVAPNRLGQHFAAERPDQKWVGDITYLWSGEGWQYLAMFKDLCTKRIVGWSVSRRMTASLVCDALIMALARRGFPAGVIVHTDRGVQYCSEPYQLLIRKHRLRCSMSGKGNCYDNAPAESFFHSLKVEAIHGELIPTRETMRRLIFEYIEVDYNRTRRHSALGYLSPEAFEAKMCA